jgi:4-amino-4-deoxy-L-arabinose transferase-like glycosyltransferase
MVPPALKITSLSRRLIENVTLYITFLCTYILWIDSVPNKLELFESWIDFYLALIKPTWSYFQYEVLSIKPNDSNQSVNAPFWALLMHSSFTLFGKSFLAYRIPGVLLTALAPVLMAEIVRRFFRADIAFLAGLAVGAHQHVIAFARTGGYIGPTLTLLLATILFGFSIAFERNRRAWWGLAAMLFLMPFFYSTVRYLCFIGLVGIAWKFLLSKEFRKANYLPLGLTIAMLVGLGFALTWGGRLDQALIFISARGEQFLITDQTVVEGFESEKIKQEHRLSALLSQMIPQRLSELSNFYHGGRRFFSHRYFVEHAIYGWFTYRPYVIGFFILGILYCLMLARNQQRYLIVPLWSLVAFLPLLVTTGITPNRMLLGVPADVLLIMLGMCLPIDLIARYLPEKVRWATKIPLWFVVLVYSYHSIYTYFYDYVKFPNL